VLVKEIIQFPFVQKCGNNAYVVMSEPFVFFVTIGTKEESMQN
jgi:hypothetical protein